MNAGISSLSSPFQSNYRQAIFINGKGDRIARVVLRTHFDANEVAISFEHLIALLTATDVLRHTCVDRGGSDPITGDVRKRDKGASRGICAMGNCRKHSRPTWRPASAVAISRRFFFGGLHKQRSSASSSITRNLCSYYAPGVRKRADSTDPHVVLPPIFIRYPSARECVPTVTFGTENFESCVRNWSSLIAMQKC